MKSKLLSKIFLIVVGFLFQFQANSQDMFVKDNANVSVYVSNQYVFIKNALELKGSNSNFYLRDGGTLLQGTNGNGANRGIGKLSVYQEGTVNNFQYNYWCSPVGNVNSATAVNNAFGIGQFARPITQTISTPVLILPANSYDGTAYPFAIAPYWVNKFIAQSGYADWIAVGSTSTIEAGQGFTMKGSSGTDMTTINGIKNNPDGKHQRYDFRGKPNDGNINIAVLTGKLTLTGNPYPSAIDLQAFLLGETNSTGTAYFWEHDKMVNSHYVGDYKGGYGTYTGANVYVPAVFFTYDGSGNQVANIGSSGNSFKRKYSLIGQGFFIEGAADGNVQMKNSYRVFVKEGALNDSEFEKKASLNKDSAKILPQIRFNTLLENGPISQTVLVFDPQSSDGVDRALDGGSINDGPANNYFLINNDEYLINVLPFNIEKKFPIGFRNKVKANYKISVNEMLNIPEVTNVYLHDKVTNLYYDIKNSFYDLTLPAGTNNKRYEITFQNGTLGVDDLQTQQFLVQQDNENKNMIIKNPEQLELVNCSLYDVVGRLVFTKNKLGNNSSYAFSTAELNNGIYIVKLTSNDKSEMGTKIIIKN